MNRGHLSQHCLWKWGAEGSLESNIREEEKQSEVDAAGSGNKLMYTQQYAQILKHSFE